MRRVFLWAARNRWLKERLPRLRVHAPRRPPVHARRDDRRRARPRRAVAGRRHRDALHAPRREPREPGRGRRGRRALPRACIDRIKAAGIDGEISVKPTQLGLDHDADACLAHLVRLAEHAAANGSYLWIDMEGSAYTDATIELYERLRATQPRTGICLQAYLRRTAADIERLLPARSGDPPGQGRLRRARGDRLPRTSARSMRTTSALAVRFLLDGRGRPIRLGLGTHDVALIEQIAAQRRPGRGRARRLRGRDALRHPDRPAVPSGEGGLSGRRRSSRTASTGIRGTCAAWPSDRPT